MSIITNRLLKKLHKKRIEEVKSCGLVLQYTCNGVNLKVISTKRTTVKMGLLHYNTLVV